MVEAENILAGKRILAVDDEEDILETIEDILIDADVDCARDYESASRKLKSGGYDLAILDIMGVDGLKLLEEAVQQQIPAVMLTAHAISPEALMTSIQKGAMAYLPKETLAELDELLTALLDTHQKGEPPWKLLFERLGDYFNERFGSDWKEKDKAFWADFSRNYQIGKGIQERLKQDRKIKSSGI
jgi:DNA-binding response OmpR family regulator